MANLSNVINVMMSILFLKSAPTVLNRIKWVHRAYSRPLLGATILCILVP